jgi:hypothetical protein
MVFFIAAYEKSTPHSSSQARLVSDNFSKAVGLKEYAKD